MLGVVRGDVGLKSLSDKGLERGMEKSLGERLSRRRTGRGCIRRYFYRIDTGAFVRRGRDGG